MRRALAVQHVAFEDLGILSRVLSARGFEIAYRDAATEAVDDLDLNESDLLVVLGGPIGAYEEALYPFLRAELDLIETCIRKQVPVLGICLGAQLIARVLGSAVYPGTAKEIGIAPLRLTDAGYSSCLSGLKEASWNVLHWHGDTFDLPNGATCLASTAITANQAFSAGDNILGLQFHIEADFTVFERWFVGHACELGAAGVVLPDLRRSARQLGPAIASAGRNVLDRWISTLPASPDTGG